MDSFAQDTRMIERRKMPALKKSVEMLRARRVMGWGEALSELKILRVIAQSGEIIRELAPQRLEGMRLRGTENAVYLAMEVINNAAPIAWDGIEADLDGNDLPPFLYPESVGYAMGWDEWMQINEDITEQPGDLALYIFLTCVRLGDRMAFEQAAEHYGWDINLPLLNENMDWGRLEALLADAGMVEFKNAIDACWYQTGNIYFDYNPYDENYIDSEDLPDFSAEGARRLASEWQLAQPIRSDLEMAIESFQRDPGLARKLMRLFGEAQGYDGTTLMEIFDEKAGQDEETETGEGAEWWNL